MAVSDGSPVGVVAKCELADGLARIDGFAETARLVLLVRAFTEPIGIVERDLPPGGLSAADLELAIRQELGDRVRLCFELAGMSFSDRIPIDGVTPVRTPEYLATRENVLREGPEITVAVCTRNRPDDLPLALRSLVSQAYPRQKILVVDNAPSDDRTRRVVSDFSSEHPGIRYVVEPNPGLSWARNRAIIESESEVIAWFDDDATCDPWWTTEIARGYVEVPDADAVTGPVMPSELVTRSQLLFERYSGIGRGRGFQRAVFSPATAATHNPLYPLPPHGVGANMSFRRSAIKRVGCFDTALGSGTITMAGEDTAALSSVLLAGGVVVYQPSALVQHRHRRDERALEAVMLGYGRGLAAFYISMLMRDPRLVLGLARIARTAVTNHFSRSGKRNTELGDFPADLLRLHRRGLLQGAFTYPIARVRAHRLRTVGRGR
jgi:GT2 family glycosyltransferase